MLLRLGLIEVKELPCLFIGKGNLVFFYVDDIVIAYDPKQPQIFEKLRTELLSKYEMTEHGQVQWFLGIRVVRDEIVGKTWLCQDAYIDKIANNQHVQSITRAHTPLQSYALVPYDGQATPQEIHQYQTTVGQIGYPSTITHPDIAKAASLLAEFLTNPSPVHQRQAYHVIAYLRDTRTLSIEYNRDNTDAYFHASSDASFADDELTRKSTQGLCFFLFGGLIDWHSTKQKSVTTSTTEAELLALSYAAKQLLYYKRMFKEIELELN